MALYQVDDPDLASARTRADQLIADLRACPIDELARLGCTLPGAPSWARTSPTQQ